jgi:hypothetical protein
MLTPLYNITQLARISKQYSVFFFFFFFFFLLVEIKELDKRHDYPILDRSKVCIAEPVLRNLGGIVHKFKQRD